jgi:hypothetical protein
VLAVLAQESADVPGVADDVYGVGEPVSLQGKVIVLPLTIRTNAVLMSGL